MYLQNKYTTWYHNIITKANQRVNQSGYFEKHHIVPKSLGGSNDKSNLVNLTPKEHFICHMLLPKMTEGNSKSKMIRAAWMIATMGNKYQNRIKIKSKKYCLLKEEWVKHNKGIPKTKEHKAKLGKYVRTDEHKEAISKMRKSQIGKHTHSNKTLKKMSAWQVGIPKPKVTCEHCGKEASLMNYRKWHGSACKFKS
jgi:hypothetical protein